MVPRIEPIFKDFGIALPHATILVIKASHLLVVVIPIVLAVIAVNLLVAAALVAQGRRSLASTWAVAMLAVPLMAIAVVVLSVSLPMIGLVQRLSG